MDDMEPINKNNTNDEDDFVIGKGFVVNDYDATERTSTVKSKKNTGKTVVKTVVWILAIVIISLGIAGTLIYAGADFLGIGFGRGDDCVLDIPQGAATQTIAEKLNDVGAVKWPFLFRVYSKLKHYDGKYKYGVYNFNTEAGYDTIADMLMTEGAKAETVKVTVPDMATVDDIAKILEEAGVCSQYDFIEAVQNYDYKKYDFVKNIPSEKVYYRLEGYLFPETYDLYSYDNSAECAVLAVDKMLGTFEEKIGKDLLSKLNSNEKYSFHELITVASLIESEAGNAGDADRAKVAQVFFNRLEGINWDGPKFLQTDPSAKYPHGSGRYDTYKTEGMIPGPIGSPSARSIKAVAEPDTSSKATYFVTDKNGDFYFNETLSAHNKTIASLKSKGLWLRTTLG